MKKTLDNPFWGEDNEPTWYHIKARCMDIYKPNGKVLTFWLWGNNESHIKELLIRNNNEYKDIEWIRKETPPFI